MIERISINTNFDEFFNSIINGNFYDGFVPVREFPNLNEELNHYRKLLSLSEKEFDYINDGRQYYQREFYFDIDLKYKYKIYWDIKKAVEIIDDNKIVLEQFKTNSLVANIDKSSLNMGNINNVTITPVIVAHYDPTNFIGAIDGNHRVYKAFLNNEENINGYLLLPKIQMEAMASPTFALIYMIHHNIIVISNYIAGNIDEISICDEGYNDCLYSITNYKRVLVQKKKSLFNKLFSVFKWS